MAQAALSKRRARALGSPKDNEVETHSESREKTNTLSQPEVKKPEKESKLDYLDKMVDLGLLPRVSGPQKINPKHEDLVTSFHIKEQIRDIVSKDAANKNLALSELVDLIYEVQQRGLFPTQQEAQAVYEDVLTSFEEYGKILRATKEIKPNKPVQETIVTNYEEMVNPDDKKMKSEASRIKEFLINAPWRPDFNGYDEVLDLRQVPDFVITFMKRNTHTFWLPFEPKDIILKGFAENGHIYRVNAHDRLFRVKAAGFSPV
jgi:hypothetical protein